MNFELSPSFISVQFVHIFEVSLTNSYNDHGHRQTGCFDNGNFSVFHVSQHTISQ